MHGCKQGVASFGLGVSCAQPDGPGPAAGRPDDPGDPLAAAAENIDGLGEHFYGYPNLVIDRATQQFVESDEPIPPAPSCSRSRAAPEPRDPTVPSAGPRGPDRSPAVPVHGAVSFICCIRAWKRGSERRGA
jgi:hypothetical protein